ncbi:MAG: virulence factor [Gammaproteobacteria bacterium]|nr:virulence factor [Gammaproteobacteria bacterium]MDH3433607.1 virulence factor [Gammaproteobacteria bacterium]
MVKLILISWRDIPAQVIVQRGRTREKAVLSQRFHEAIDRAAMRAGKGSSDAYMSEWRRDASTLESSDELRQIAEREVARLEAKYSDERLLELIRAHGSASVE